MRIESLAIAAVLVAGATPATAQVQGLPPPISVPDTAAAAPSRYNFDRVADVFMRLDRVTGQVSVCSQHSAGWACQAVPEERAAFENEIARLQSDIATLKEQIAVLRAPPPPRPPADLSSRDKEPEVTIKMPTQEDIERARVAVTHAWQRLVDMIVSFKNDMMKKG
ncbi:MAG TPA: hypothetical protein VFC54_08800 [Pseudolabrys sp.]|nr:hypothetical protein [Pseudolabrys sp.]